MGELVKFGKHERAARSYDEVLDRLRDDLDSGKVVGFFAVALDDEDGTYLYRHMPGVSRLRYMGATAFAHHCACSGEESEGC